MYGIVVGTREREVELLRCRSRSFSRRVRVRVSMGVFAIGLCLADSRASLGGIVRAIWEFRGYEFAATAQPSGDYSFFLQGYRICVLRHVGLSMVWIRVFGYCFFVSARFSCPFTVHLTATPSEGLVAEAGTEVAATITST